MLAKVNDLINNAKLTDFFSLILNTIVFVYKLINVVL